MRIFRYFFGTATEAEGAEFHRFTLAHFLPILLAAGVVTSSGTSAISCVRTRGCDRDGRGIRMPKKHKRPLLCFFFLVLLTRGFFVESP